MSTSSTESEHPFVDSAGESQDETSGANQPTTARFRFLHRVHLHLDMLDARRRQMHLRRQARREFRRNQRILQLERRAEMSARLNFSAQLRHFSALVDDLREANRFHIMRYNNVIRRSAAVVQLNNRLIRRNRFLQERLNRIYLTLRPAVHFNPRQS